MVKSLGLGRPGSSPGVRTIIGGFMNAENKRRKFQFWLSAYQAALNRASYEAEMGTRQKMNKAEKRALKIKHKLETIALTPTD